MNRTKPIRSTIFRILSSVFTFILIAGGTPQYAEAGTTYGTLGDWASTSSNPASTSQNKVAYGNGTFVTISSDTICYSANGQTWTKVSTNLVPSGTVLNTVAFGGDEFVIEGVIIQSGNPDVEVALTSTDGINWSSQSITNGSDLTDLVYGNGQWIGIESGNNVVYTSRDGIHWTVNGLNSVFFSAIAYGNDTFVIVGDGFSFTSTDGANWTAHAEPAVGDGTFAGVVYENGKFVAIGNGVVLYSSDGASWMDQTASSVGNFGHLRGLAFGSGRFVAFDPDNGTIMTSEDGGNWRVDRSPMPASWINSVTDGGGQFLGVGTSSVYSAVVPEQQSATVAGTTLTLTYSCALDNTTIPSASDFSVSDNGLSISVDGVSITNNTVTLSLAASIPAGDNVTLSYSVGSQPIEKVLDGTLQPNQAAGFASLAVHNPVSVTGVTLDQSTLSLSVGTSSQLHATVAPNTAPDQAVTWSTSDNTVATVDANGNITAVAPGTATITVTTHDGSYTANCAVTVTRIAVTGITLDKTSLTLTPGGSSVQLHASVSPTNATYPSITWSSDKNAVAQVDSNGNVTPESAGSATITATTDGGGFTAACIVTVSTTPTGGSTVGTLTIVPSTTTVTSGQAISVTGTVYDGQNNPVPGASVDLTSPSGSWESATVTTDGSGNYTAQWTAPTVSSQTSATVTASVNGVNSQATITVNPAPSTSGSTSGSTDGSTDGSTGGSTGGSISTPPVGEPSSFPTTILQQTVGINGGTWSTTLGSSTVSLVVPSGAFSSPETVQMTSGHVMDLGNKITGLTENHIAALFGAEFSGAAPSQPITVMIENPSISASAVVYKLTSSGDLQPMHATVTQGKVEVSFTTDPDFIVFSKEASQRVILSGSTMNLVPSVIRDDGGTETTYMPIWYVMKLLNSKGINSTWDGHNWHLSTENKVALASMKPGKGTMNVYVNGSLVENVTGTYARDPSTNKNTTYMPIWYVQQVLDELGVQNTWDGITWTVS